MAREYNHQEVERKWQAAWERDGVYHVSDSPASASAYVLDMFPYPSAQGLHVGHPEGYTASDIYSRYLRARGTTVLHPMGFDAFGLPAENYAIKTGTHPAKTTQENIDNMRQQIKRLGFSYDWEREVITSDPRYYKWTQWIFIQLFKHGLAYESDAPINWCPKDKTGLANEEVIDGKCERCGTPVTKKQIKQWLVKITDAKYIERLLHGLDTLDWPESIKTLQRNWIGRSEGAEIKFEILNPKSETNSNSKAINSKQYITVFTTRPDTLFGATYMVLSPEHQLVDVITTDKQKKTVDKYKKEAAAKSDLERTDLAKEKTGVFTGAYAINPANEKKVPIWIADYVLSSYGTGAIMAVPAHDERDHAFAEKFKLPIVQVIKPARVMPAMNPPMGSAAAWGMGDSDLEYTCWTGDGQMMNSGKYDGLDSVEGKEKIIADLEKKGVGRKAVNYKLRDWLFSRQRYWGEPIPIVHCEKCGNVAVPEDQLPLELPNVEKYEPTGTGESPLAAISDWVNTTCPECGGPAKRETNTMPQWAGSNWYWLRYCDPRNNTQLADPEKLKAWLPVDMYVGGAEHAVLHLLYARFIYMFLYDIGAVPQEVGEEPFAVLKNQGLIMGEDGQKMSKSRGNVINPDDVVDKYGADVLRMYEMFMGPFEDAKPWSTQGIVGIRRFVEKVWDVGARTAPDAAASDDVLVHGTIKSITEKIEQFRFNTCISDLMKWSNAWSGPVNQSEFEIFIMLLAPFAPHLAQELWSQLGHDSYIAQEQWPAYDEFKIVETEITYAIQVNGKVRDTITVPAATDEQGTIQIALQQEKVQKHLKGEPKKTIFVKDKLVNFVT